MMRSRAHARADRNERHYEAVEDSEDPDGRGRDGGAGAAPDWRQHARDGISMEPTTLRTDYEPGMRAAADSHAARLPLARWWWNRVASRSRAAGAAALARARQAADRYRRRRLDSAWLSGASMRWRARRRGGWWWRGAAGRRDRHWYRSGRSGHRERPRRAAARSRAAIWARSHGRPHSRGRRPWPRVFTDGRMAEWQADGGSTFPAQRPLATFVGDSRAAIANGFEGRAAGLRAACRARLKRRDWKPQSGQTPAGHATCGGCRWDWAAATAL